MTRKVVHVAVNGVTGPLVGVSWPIRYKWSDADRVAHLRAMGVRMFSAPRLPVPGDGRAAHGSFGIIGLHSPGHRSSDSTGSGRVPALCSSSRHRPYRTPRTDHEQLDSGPSTPNSSSGMPSSRDMPSRSAAP
jgi:hypothetical protein